MTTFAHDLRFALRVLARRPGFTLVVVVTLGLGIGLNTAVFSVVNGLLVKPFPVERPGELVGIYRLVDDGFLTHAPTSFLDYAEIRDGTTGFSGVVAYGGFPLALETGAESEFVLGDAVSCNYFSVLGVSPVVGRAFTAADDRGPATVPAAVLSYASWRSRFGSDPDIVGRAVRVNGTAVTVLGVAPRGFSGLQRGLAPELWLPVATAAALSGDRGLQDRSSNWLFVMGRLSPDASLAQVRTEVDAIAARLTVADSENRRDVAYAVLPADEVCVLPGAVDRAIVTTSLVLLALVAVVLAITGANVTNVMLARAAGRQREFAVRLATGASRWRLVRQLLTESLVVAALGGLGGIGLAWLVDFSLNRVSLPLPLQLRVDAGVDWRVVAYATGLSVVTAVLVGLVPALTGTRRGLASALTADGRGSSMSRDRRRLQGSLVVVQVALSLVLLTGAGLAVRSLASARDIDPGFAVRGVATAVLPTELVGLDATQSQRLVKDVLDRLANLAQVESASAVTTLPLGASITLEAIVADGGEPAPESERPQFDTAAVAPRYFETMGIPIVRGRPLDDTDVGPAPRHVVVNEVLAERFWPGQDPIGRWVRLEGRPEPAEVVGVARTGKYRTLGEDARPFFYTALYERGSRRVTLVVRTTSEAHLLLPAIREEIRRVDQTVPIVGLQTLETAISTSLLVPRAAAVLFGTFGALGLVLASVGLYGVLAFAVAQRTREFGIRQALGASPGDVLRLVVGRGLRLAGVGVAIGLGLSFAATRAIASILYGISPTDAPTFAAVIVILVAVVALACWIPARRAIRNDPAVTLRYE